MQTTKTSSPSIYSAHVHSAEPLHNPWLFTAWHTDKNTIHGMSSHKRKHDPAKTATPTRRKPCLGGGIAGLEPLLSTLWLPFGRAIYDIVLQSSGKVPYLHSPRIPVKIRGPLGAASARKGQAPQRGCHGRV